jgi:hypothetical protein
MEGPNTIRSIENLVPKLYPGLTLSYGKIWGVLAEAQQRARVFNQSTGLSAIVAGAVDEMYSQGAPVLAGAGLASGYLFALALRSSRSSDDWAQVLRPCQQQGMELKTVVKDAALGIAAGVREVYPNAEQRDDCFHALFEMGKVYFQLERKAYAALEKAEDAKENKDLCRRTGRGHRATLQANSNAAMRRCNKALERHGLFEQAMRRAQEAMEVADPADGRLRRAEWIESELKQAAKHMMALEDPKCRQVARYLSNRAPGLASHARQIASHMAVLGVSQGFLELYRAHYNLKTRRWGRHKGTSAHEQVTGQQVDDWLTTLGYPPSSTVN